MAKLPTLAFHAEDMFGIVGSRFIEDPVEGLDEEEAAAVIESLDLAHDYAWFGPRHYIENDPAFIHILPYCIVRLNGKILGYNRASSGEEGRLHGNFSIGVGGHIDMIDIAFDEDVFSVSETVENSWFRELYEEIGVTYDNIIRHRFAAVMYDSSNDVGKTHIAFVQIIDLSKDHNPNALVKNAENHLLNCRWLTVEEAKGQENPENWTKFLLNDAVELGLEADYTDTSHNTGDSHENPI